MPKMVEVVIESIRAAFMGQQRLVLLRQVDDERFLAIVIDPYIAEQIAFGLQDLEIERPMSHDLLNQTIEQLRGKILRVEVVELKNQIYYGNIVIET
ncbi:MAG: bifunctional nuclease family protein, partial [Anaerolineae bacterium]|nr:bifunctional nuclease family protein [Anaerolineae bacterium]